MGDHINDLGKSKICLKQIQSPSRFHTELIKECMSDYVTNYNYVGDTKVSVSIKKTNANKINAH